MRSAVRQQWDGWTVQERRVWIRQSVVAVVIHRQVRGDTISARVTC